MGKLNPLSVTNRWETNISGDIEDLYCKIFKTDILAYIECITKQPQYVHCFKVDTQDTYIKIDNMQGPKASRNKF